EKFETKKETESIPLPDLFNERERMLFGKEPCENEAGPILVGVPRVLYMHSQFPFWKTFLNELNTPFIISDWTNKEILASSADTQNAETCLPAKITQGHIINLIKKKVTHILFPSVITLGGECPEGVKNYSCPLVQTAPQMANAALHEELKKNSIELITPEIHLQDGSYKRLINELTKTGHSLKVPGKAVKEAVEKAFQTQKDFNEAVIQRGKEILSMIEEKKIKAVVIISRPYNGCDCGLNFNLPQKLKEMGVVAIPMDFLPYDRAGTVYEKNMYWKSGQEFLRVSTFIKGKKELPAIHLSNFKCGPDSFTSHFLRRKFENHPFLELELDEHNADAGFITRCEAFFDSIEHR
ncbi:MAG: acyl-CoA dehydratase activase-related protein, partial [Nitrospinota bacterium]